MWLPTKDERDLLVHYYKKIERPNEWHTFDMFEKGNDVIPIMNVENNNRLVDWKLIEVKYQTVEWRVKLTDKGWEFGSKYAGFFDRIGLWCAAKEHQWLWGIIIFVAGLLVKCLYDLFIMIIKNNK